MSNGRTVTLKCGCDPEKAAGHGCKRCRCGKAGRKCVMCSCGCRGLCIPTVRPCVSSTETHGRQSSDARRGVGCNEAHGESMSDLHPGDMNVDNEEENGIGGVVCDDAHGDHENDHEGER